MVPIASKEHQNSPNDRHFIGELRRLGSEQQKVIDEFRVYFTLNGERTKPGKTSVLSVGKRYDFIITWTLNLEVALLVLDVQRSLSSSSVGDPFLHLSITILKAHSPGASIFCLARVRFCKIAPFKYVFKHGVSPTCIN